MACFHFGSFFKVSEVFLPGRGWAKMSRLSIQGLRHAILQARPASLGQSIIVDRFLRMSGS